MNRNYAIEDVLIVFDATPDQAVAILQILTAGLPTVEPSPTDEDSPEVVAN